jgi:hypothetical protein
VRRPTSTPTSRQVEIARPHDAGALDVDELTVEHVLGHADLAVARLVVAQVHSRRRELDPFGVHRRDLSGRHPHGAPAHPHDQPGHGRVAAVVPPHDDVDHAADFDGGTVDDRSPDQPGQREQRVRGQHGATARQRTRQ